MKLYLALVDKEAREAVHGVDYTKGGSCGRKHEYRTRNCKPVFYTEDDIKDWGPSIEFVEIVPSIEIKTSIESVEITPKESK